MGWTTLDNRANYTHWLSLPFWTMDEAVVLLLDREPGNFTVDDIIYMDPEEEYTFKSLRRILERNFPEGKAEPREIIDRLIGLRISMPKELLADLAQRVTPTTSSETPKSASPPDFEIDELCGAVRFNGKTFNFSPIQMSCLRILEKHYHDFQAGRALTNDMPQGEILRAAKAAPNVKRLDQVFRGRPEGFHALIEKVNRGRYRLNLPQVSKYSPVH